MLSFIFCKNHRSKAKKGVGPFREKTVIIRGLPGAQGKSAVVISIKTSCFPAQWFRLFPVIPISHYSHINGTLYIAMPLLKVFPTCGAEFCSPIKTDRNIGITSHAASSILPSQISSQRTSFFLTRSNGQSLSSLLCMRRLQIRFQQGTPARFRSMQGVMIIHIVQAFAGIFFIWIR